MTTPGQMEAGTAKVDSLTSGRITFAGASGLLSDSANLTFNPATSTVTLDNFVANTTVTTANAYVTSLGTNGIVFAGAGGEVLSNVNITFDPVLNILTTINIDATLVTSTNVTVSSLTSGNITFAGPGGSLIDTTDLTFNSSTKTLSVANINATAVKASIKSVNTGNVILNTTGTTAVFTGNVTGQVSDISNHTTTELTEGTNLYYTDARVRSAVSANDAGGDGSFSYDSLTGIFTYTGPNDSEVRAHFSAIDAGGDGSFSYDSATGAFTYTGPNDSEVRAHFSAATSGTGHGGLTYDATTGVYTYAKVTASDVRGDISATKVSGDGSISYDNLTGIISYTGPSDSEVRAHFGAYTASGIEYTQSTGVFSLNQIPNSSLVNDTITINGTSVTLGGSNSFTSDSVNEGMNNLYFLASRARQSVSLTTDNTDAMSYDNTTGVFTFTLNSVYTDEIAEGQTNLYFTTARARNTISNGANIDYDATTGIISTQAAVWSVNGQTHDVVLTTNDINEGSTNLYFTNARASGAVSLVSDNTDILQYNQGTGVLTFVTPNTDAIAEGMTNLYYTDSRVLSKINITSINELSDVDLSTGLQDGYTLIWSSAAGNFVPQNVSVSSVNLNFTGDGTTTSFSSGVAVQTIDNTQVYVNGLIQAPTYSYTLSNDGSGITSIVFDTAPEANDYVMIKVIATSQLSAGGILNEQSTVDGGTY